MDGSAAAVGIEPAPRVMRVLVLDNDRTMRELISFALRVRGLETLAVGTKEEAEAAFRDVDGLLLDFHLGGGHVGSEVARMWAAEGRLPPFWVVTGMPEDPEVQALKELKELVAVVGKPFSLLDLAEGVEATLRNLAPSNGASATPSPCEERACDDFSPQAEPEPPSPPEVEEGPGVPPADLH